MLDLATASVDLRTLFGLSFDLPVIGKLLMVSQCGSHVNPLAQNLFYYGRSTVKLEKQRME